MLLYSFQDGCSWALQQHHHCSDLMDDAAGVQKLLHLRLIAVL